MNNDNELIAEFMGFTQKSYTRTSEKLWCDNKHGLPVGELKFNDSWDWLMPVVEKIETLGFGFTVDPWGMVIIEYISGKEKEIISFINDNNYPKIFQYYHTVTQFIKWYNDQKK